MSARSAALWRLKVRTCLTSAVARALASWTTASRACALCSSGRSIRARSALPMIAVRMLLKSGGMPPARVPGALEPRGGDHRRLEPLAVGDVADHRQRAGDRAALAGQ